MKIGIDYHGVLTANPKLFSALSKTLIKAGWEVHFITGERLTPSFLKKVAKLRFKFTHSFSILDYHIKNKTTKAWKDKRGWWLDRDIWNYTKAWYCKSNKIDLHIDDSDEYGKYFSTPYLRFFEKGSLMTPDITKL